MDLLLRRRRRLLLLAAAGAAGYGAYKVYYLPTMVERRRRLGKFLRAMASLAETFSSSAETFELLSQDMNNFIRSDSSEIPPSLKQISKIAVSEEFSASISQISQSLTAGILLGIQNHEKSTKLDPNPESSLAERILDKLFSTAGSDFASIAVGSFARNLITAVYSSQSEIPPQSAENSLPPPWIDLLCSEKVKILLGHCIKAFVGTGVAVYLEKTMDLNAFDDLFSGLTNPKHEARTKELLISLCNNAVETLIKTSHRVLASSATERDEEVELEAESKGNSGWVDVVSSTLAVPTNRSFVLDLTGRVTSETVKSFLEMVPPSLSYGARRSAKMIRGEIAEKGSEVMRDTWRQIEPSIEDLTADKVRRSAFSTAVRSRSDDGGKRRAAVELPPTLKLM